MKHLTLLPLALAMLCCLTFQLPSQAGDTWTESAPLELAELNKAVTEAAKKDKNLTRQPTVLAYKAALFFSTKSLDTPTNGMRQSIAAEFTGGEEDFKAAKITVEFMGYADDSLTGERFVLDLVVEPEGTWQIQKAGRAAFGRGDHR